MDTAAQLNKNQSKNPIVSIMMCTYNRAAYLKEAIESVLKQGFQDWELLILDDASTDETSKIVAPFLSDSRIRYIVHKQNLGLAQNRNAGLSEAQGKYLAILDSDDLWSDRTKLKMQIEFLEENPSYGLIGTFGKKINEKGQIIGNMMYDTEDYAIRSHILSFQQFLHSAVVYRTFVVKEMGGFDNSLAPAEDYELILRIGTKYKLANISLFMVNYREHSGNSSSNDRQKKINHAKLHLQVIKKYSKNYPRFWIALIKAYLRIIYKYIF